MRLDLFALAATLALTATAHAKRPAAPRDPAQRDARGCPRIKQQANNDARATTFTLENRCGWPIRCEISWTTRCDTSEPARHADGAALDGHAAASFPAPSGCSSEQRWEVSAPTYDCHAAPAADTTAAADPAR